MATLTFRVPDGTPVRQCARCPQLIAFVPTSKGKLMPVNVPEGHPIDEVGVAEPRRIIHGEFRGESHYATCPHTQDFRRPRT